MGTKMVILALLLLVPAAVSAEAEGGNDDATETCDPVEVFLNPPNAAVHPDCLLIFRAEESK